MYSSLATIRSRFTFFASASFLRRAGVHSPIRSFLLSWRLLFLLVFLQDSSSCVSVCVCVCVCVWIRLLGLSPCRLVSRGRAAANGFLGLFPTYVLYCQGWSSFGRSRPRFAVSLGLEPAIILSVRRRGGVVVYSAPSRPTLLATLSRFWRGGQHIPSGRRVLTAIDPAMKGWQITGTPGAH